MTQPPPLPPGGPAGPPPLVSVIIPAYNVAPYIREAVESVLAQTYPRWEIQLVNDGSSDTVELERELEPFRTRLSYQVQANLGAGAARNAAIRAAQGELLAFLDGDDRWDPEFLERQVAWLQQGGYDLVYADARHFGELAIPGETSMGSSPSVGTPTLETLLDLSCHVLTSTTLVRRELVVAAGAFDETIRRGQDFELWLRLAQRGARIGYQRTVLASYRRREASLSGDPVQRAERALALYRLVQQKLVLPLPLQQVVARTLTTLEAEHSLEAGKAKLLAGDYAAAAVLLREAWRRRPTPKLLAARMALKIAPGLLRRTLLRS